MNATALAPLFLAAGLSPVALPEPPAAPAARPADALAAAFKAKIVFQGTAEERAFFESLEDRLLESPTMRELAERFVAAPGTMTARFAELPGTELYERYENLMDFTAPEAGHLVRGEDAATIVLNSACLLVHRDYALEDCGAHLAHEVFGHGLGWMEAGAHGLRANYIHYDDELFARLVGWVFRAETAGRVRDPEAACAAADLAAHQAYIRRTYPSSAASLTVDELDDPLGRYAARREEASPRAKALIDAAVAGLTPERVEALRAAGRAEFFRGLPARDQALAARLPRDPEALFQGLGCGDYR